MATVAIRKGMLAALIAIACIGVLGLVFLLGRESGQMTQDKPRTGSGNSALTPSKMPAQVSSSEPTNAVIPSLSGPGGFSPSGSPEAISPGSPIPSSDPADPSYAAVAAYFQAVKAIQPAASSDPEAMANQVMAGLAKGDLSGFEGMLQQASLTRSRLAAITPPQPCTAYHREGLECLDAGLALLRDMKQALSSSGQDASASNLADRANDLKARTDALQLQEMALQRRYGLMK